MTMLSDGMLLGVGGGAALPTIVGSSIQTADNGNTLTVAKPSGTANGDVIWAFVWGNNFSTLELPGFTQIFVDTAAALDFAVYRKDAGASEPSDYSFTQTVGTRTCVMVTTRGGLGTVDVQGTTPNTASSATAVGLSITPAATGLLFASFGLRTIGTVSTAPAGMSYVNGVVGLSSVSVALYSLSPSSAGATGNKTLVWNTSSTSGGWLVQIH